MQKQFLKKTLMAFIGLVMLATFIVTPGMKTVSAQAGPSFYVSPDGRPENDGSLERPWDLQTAFNQPANVVPGSTVILRGGTYNGTHTLRLKGAPGQNIRVISYQAELVTLTNSDGPAMDIADAWYVDFRGLEIAGPRSNRSTSRSESTYGVRVNQGMSADHINFFNMVFHDNQAQGIGWWQALKNSMIYGSFFYHNGTTQLDHGVYVHSIEGNKVFKDNVVFNNASHGFHGYAETNEKGLNNLTITGNTFFNNGSIGYNTRKDKYGIMTRNILVGGLIPANNTVITDNYTYLPGSEGTSLNLGYKGGSNNSQIYNNFFMGGEFAFGSTNANAAMSGNTIYAPGGIHGLEQASFSNNAWLSAKPTGLNYFVRPSEFWNNRANLTIYNWNRNDTVYIPAAALGGVRLAPGQAYELRNVQNFFEDISTGVYDGQGITIDMVNRSVAQPYGLDFKPASTFPEFGVFLLVAK